VAHPREISRATRAIRSRTSLETLGCPPRQRPHDRYLQSSDQAVPAPAQRGLRLDDHQIFVPLPHQRDSKMIRERMSKGRVRARPSYFETVRLAAKKRWDQLSADEELAPSLTSKNSGASFLFQLTSPEARAFARHANPPLDERFRSLPRRLRRRDLARLSATPRRCLPPLLPAL